MLYTPKFCCECGAAIDRSDWKLWTSRRFCKACEGDFKKYEWLPRVVVALALLIGIFGFGSFLKKTDKPLSVATVQTNSALPNKNQNVQSVQLSANSNSQTSAQKPATNDGIISGNALLPSSSGSSQKQPATGQISTVEQSVVSEAVYICGAQTKKGTPCSRRVRGGGRCWQHLGQPAILPREKLLVARQNRPFGFK